MMRSAPLLAALLTAAMSRPSAADTPSDLLKRLDPTDFRTRFETRVEHQETQDGGHRDLLVPRLDYAVSKAFSLRIETPVLRYDPDTRAASTQRGFGDLLVRGAWRVVRTPGLAVVAGSEFIFDTATEPAIGYGKHVAAPFVFAAWDVPSWQSTIFPGIQHYESVGGQAGRAHVSYTQVRLFILTRWPNRFYTGIENQFTIDYERGSRVGYTIETELGRFLDRHWAVWIRPGFALLGDRIPYVYNWNMELGLRYLFD
ncbi:MAG: hypothetical protein JNL33_03935 [Betaproteobacteria bacterium]|nr:hypothetical protein [Betaproteobacteria bacterium]